MKEKKYWNYPWHFEAALERHYAGRHREALEIIDDGVSRYPDNAEMYWLRGITHEMLGDNVKALEDLALCSCLAGEHKRHVRKDVSRVIKKLVAEGVDTSWARVFNAYGQYAEGDAGAAVETSKRTKLGWLSDYLTGIYCQAAGRSEEAREYLARVMDGTDIADTEVRRKVMHLLAAREREGHGEKEKKTDGTDADKLRGSGEGIQNTA